MDEHEHEQPDPAGRDESSRPQDAERGAALERVVEQARSAALLGETDDVRRTVAELLRDAGLQASPHDVDAVVSAVGDAPSGG